MCCWFWINLFLCLWKSLHFEILFMSMEFCVVIFFLSFEAAGFLLSHSYFHISPTAIVLPSLLIVYFNIWSCFSFERLYIRWLSCEWIVFLGFLRCEFNELTEYLYSFIIFQKFLATPGSSDMFWETWNYHIVCGLYIEFLLTLFSLLCILYRFILSSTFFPL